MINYDPYDPDHVDELYWEEMERRADLLQEREAEKAERNNNHEHH